MVENSTDNFSTELGNHREKLTEQKVPSVALTKGTNILYEQGNTRCQCSNYIICIFDDIDYDGLSIANMKEWCEKLREGCKKKQRTED